jgi:hypothetical protein
MKTTAELKQRSDGTLQFIAARLNKWDITSLVDTTELDVKGLTYKVKAGESVTVVVEIKDNAVEDVIRRLMGYANHNYVQAVYGIPESFRFP